MTQLIQSLPGFRDLYPRDCAIRNYLFDVWRRVAARYGFSEWEGPTIESAEMYRRKSGDEITQQLFWFVDKGGREVALRPELTPTLARMAAARHRDYKKPIKWFQIGTCFRYEAPQKGRLREFCQWNADVLGEASVEADAELIALGIDSLRELGFGASDFAVRVSDRHLWDRFLAEEEINSELAAEFLQIIDKWDRESAEVIEGKLRNLGTSRPAVGGFIERMKSDEVAFGPLLSSLAARGLRDFVRIDPGIVRGLAYYTGTVFEFFALKHGLRAIAGGGRYDDLCGVMSDGAVNLPASGFAMGDVVLTELIGATPAAMTRLNAALREACALDVYVVIADESQRAMAFRVVQVLRDGGLRCDIAMAAAKVSKQFQAAEALRARTAVLVGAEFPEVRIKDLASRQEVVSTFSELLVRVRQITAKPACGPLLADAPLR